MTGLTCSAPVRRPRWCNRMSGAPSNWPPTRPKGLARFNRRVTNRVLGPLAQRLPGFGIVIHVGRRSGAVRRTPVNVFHRGDRYVIALTYGADSQWVRNV